jgi:preprotein translocase subunit SecG
MDIILIAIHVFVCIALIMIVLLQTGKGADMGAAFGGGGSQTLFGSTGASTFLSKMTTAAAIIFMLTSLVLAYMSSNRQPESIMTNQPAAESTTEETAAPAAEATTDEAAAPAAEATTGEEAPPSTDTEQPAPATGENTSEGSASE